MTLLVKDANTSVQPLATELDGSGNLVPMHAPASVVQGIASPVGPQNPLPVINTAGAAASDGSGTVAAGGSAQMLFGGTVPANGFSGAEQFVGGIVGLRRWDRLERRCQHPDRRRWRAVRDAAGLQAGRRGRPLWRDDRPGFRRAPVVAGAMTNAAPAPCVLRGSFRSHLRMRTV
jgi:hypothetical protein